MGKGLGLTRRTGDKIYIGDDIEISFEKVAGGEAKVCIKAPAHMGIHRDAAHVGLRIAASIKKGR